MVALPKSMRNMTSLITSVLQSRCRGEGVPNSSYAAQLMVNCKIVLIPKNIATYIGHSSKKCELLSLTIFRL